MPRVRQNQGKYRAKDFRKEVKKRLGALEMRQHDLAERLGVSDGTVSHMLAKPESIQVGRLREMIVILQLEPEAVLRLYGYPERTIGEVTK